jgi:hypothetical protein
MLSNVTHFFIVHFLGAPRTLDRNEPALSLQVLLPLALQKELSAAIWLVRTRDLLKLATGNMFLFI